jgi:ferredoxin--NADP+ reductase
MQPAIHPETTVNPVNPSEIPSNLYKLQAPWAAEVVAIKRLTAETSANDVQHIVLNLAGSNYHYVEGQSAGILPPGTDAEGKPHKLRLYSIASAAIGDDRQSQTLTLCVKRAITTDPATGTIYPGVCSNYLCDLTVGDKVQMTGPVGKAFILPPISEQPNLVMIGTGTGIAPFRAFLDVAYDQQQLTQGNHWLFFGVQSCQDYLYGDVLDGYAKDFANFNLVTAFSREEKTPTGDRMYVQHRLAEHGKALMATLQAPNTYVYICGLKGMEQGILQGLAQAAELAGLDWPTLYNTLKTSKRWHVEVY